MSQPAHNFHYAGPNQLLTHYAAPARYDNKTDKPGAPSFLNSEGKPDLQAAEENPYSIECFPTITIGEEVAPMMELATGAQNAILAEVQAPLVPREVRYLYNKAYSVMELYWVQGWSSGLKTRFEEINAAIRLENARQRLEEHNSEFPGQAIIKMFEIYQPLLRNLTHAPPDQQKKWGRKLIGGIRMFLQWLSQRRLNFFCLVTKEVWAGFHTLFVNWATENEILELLRNFWMPSLSLESLMSAASKLSDDFIERREREITSEESQ